MPTKTRQTYVEFVTIPSGSYSHTAGPPIDLTERILESIILPTSWTPAAICFSGSPYSKDPATGYGWLGDSRGRVYKIATIQAGGQYQVPAKWLAQTNYLYLVSGDLSLGLTGLVNQAADRVLTLVLKDRYPVTIVGG